MKKKKQSQPKPLKAEKMGSIPVPERKFPWAAALIVAGITFLVYLPALKNGFVGAWDDNVYVYNNQAIQSIDFRLFSWIPSVVIWHPVTMISLAMDYTFWGLNPLGYHLTNNIIHALNTFLVFVLIIQLIEKGTAESVNPAADNRPIIVAIVVALLFGLHPLHVESVAWVSERKDVLSAFFFLLSLLAYLKYASEPIFKKYTIFYSTSLALFILALMSKPVVTLPIILLVLDFYPLQRLTRHMGQWDIRSILVEKIPFFIFSVITSLVTIWAHHSVGGLPTSEQFTIIFRILTAVRASIFYLIKMILPLNLAPLYPLPPKINLFSVEYLGAVILLLTITFLCIWFSKKSKLFLGVWTYYIVTLIPVVGIIQVARHSAADRYTYLSSLGPFLLAGIGVAYLYERYDHRKLLIIFASFFLLWMSKMTVTQIDIWKDPVTLWSYEMKMFPSVYISYNNRGNAYKEAGEFQKAIKDYSEAIRLNPIEPLLYVNRGVAYSYLGKYQEGLIDINEAIKLNPKYLLAYYNRGALFQESGDFKQAIKDYGKVIELNPEHAEAYYNRGMAYDSLGDYQEALKDFSRAIELDRKHIDAYNKRGGIFFEKGEYQQAINDYSRVIKLNPQHADAYYNRGVVYNSIGNYLQAINDFDIAIKLNATDSMYYTNRGSANSSVGNHEQAIKDYSKAIELNPKDAYAYYNLGNVYSQTGNMEQAIINYKKAANLGLKEAQSLLK